MKMFLLLSSIFIIGCQKIDENNIRMSRDWVFAIPDSNKQKYADFVSKSISGCKDNCRYLLYDIQKIGGEMFGIKTYSYNLFYYKNNERIEKEHVLKSQMNEDELRAVNEKFPDDN